MIASPLLRCLTGLALLAILAACAGLGDYRERPKVSLVSLSLVSGGALEQRFAIKLRVTNPNDAALDITGLSLDLEVNDISIATVVSDELVKVPRFGSEVMEAKANANLLVLPRILRDAAKSGGVLRYHVRGRVALGSSTGRAVAGLLAPVVADIHFEHRGEFQVDIH